MNRRIVVAIDADISPQTQHVLRVASSLLELSALQLGVVLLHVIPVPSMPQSKFGMSRVAPTAEQRELAEQALHSARIELQKQGIVPEQIAVLLRSGIPADEIVKAAKELEADFIMIGSRGNSLKQKMRRVLMGSTSHRVVKRGPCPVMIAALPESASASIQLQLSLARGLARESGSTLPSSVQQQFDATVLAGCGSLHRASAEASRSRNTGIGAWRAPDETCRQIAATGHLDI